MAETEINVLNRPTVLSTAWGAMVQAWPVLTSLAVAAFMFGLWLVHLEGKTDTAVTDIAGITAGLKERDARWAADAKSASDRVDRIEESRTIGLQRLATVEEAVKGEHEILQDIRSKIDRALLGGRGR